MRGRSSFFFFIVAGLVLCAASTAQAELVNYWTFDSDGTDSVTGLSGTLIGDAAFTNTESAVGAGALKIAHNTSNGDYFDVNYKVIPDHSVYTVTGWYKWDASFSSQAVDSRGFVYETTPSYSSSVGIYTDAYSPTFWADGQTSNISALNFGSGSINDNTWHFFAVSYDTVSNQATYYHDGTQTATSVAPLIVATDGIHLGSHRTADGTRNWQGYIDDFAVYEGTIDAAGISALYNGTATPETVTVDESNLPNVPDDDLVAYWTFDSDFETSVNSEHFTSTPQGGTAYTSIDTSGIAVRGAGALKLDSGPNSGNGTFVEVDGSVFDNARDKQVAISAWFRCEDISGDGSDSRRMICESSPTYSLSLGVDDTAELQWYTNTDEGGFHSEGPVIANDQWYHVVANYDLEAGIVQLFCNGVLVSEDPIDGSTFDFCDGFKIGNHRTGDGTRDFDGYIDDVAVFHGVLSPGGVAGLYTGTFSPTNVPVFENLSAVPEPSILVLLAGLLLTAVWLKRR